MTKLSVTGICQVGAVMEPGSNFRHSGAVPFCSHSRIISAWLSNYEAPGFKIRRIA
jgi:hypothetical protein